jgi:hypothetical protein
MPTKHHWDDDQDDDTHKKSKAAHMNALPAPSKLPTSSIKKGSVMAKLLAKLASLKHEKELSHAGANAPTQAAVSIPTLQAKIDEEKKELDAAVALSKQRDENLKAKAITDQSDREKAAQVAEARLTAVETKEAALEKAAAAEVEQRKRRDARREQKANDEAKLAVPTKVPLEDGIADDDLKDELTSLTAAQRAEYDDKVNTGRASVAKQQEGQNTKNKQWLDKKRTKLALQQTQIESKEAAFKEQVAETDLASASKEAVFKEQVAEANLASEKAKNAAATEKLNAEKSKLQQELSMQKQATEEEKTQERERERKANEVTGQIGPAADMRAKIAAEKKELDAALAISKQDFDAERDAQTKAIQTQAQREKSAEVRLAAVEAKEAALEKAAAAASEQQRQRESRREEAAEQSKFSVVQAKIDEEKKELDAAVALSKQRDENLKAKAITDQSDRKKAAQVAEARLTAVETKEAALEKAAAAEVEQRKRRDARREQKANDEAEQKKIAVATAKIDEEKKELDAAVALSKQHENDAKAKANEDQAEREKAAEARLAAVEAKEAALEKSAAAEAEQRKQREASRKQKASEEVEQAKLAAAKAKIDEENTSKLEAGRVLNRQRRTANARMDGVGIALLLVLISAIPLVHCMLWRSNQPYTRTAQIKPSKDGWHHAMSNDAMIFPGDQHASFTYGAGDTHLDQPMSASGRGILGAW